MRSFARLRARARAGLAVAGAVALLAAAAASNAAGAADTLGITTLEQRIIPNSDPDFRELGLGPGEPYIVREEGIGAAQPGRDTRRVSLAYIGQISDFQLADEESPARVEFADSVNAFFGAAWRPSEIVNAQIDDAMVQQINAFAPASPVAAAGGARRPMDFAIGTGDLADSQQLNETEWVRTLYEGGALNSGSGVDPTGYLNAATGLPHQLCAPFPAATIADSATPSNYTGVADFDDYDEGMNPRFYDPDDPDGPTNDPTDAYAHFPVYPNLANNGQLPFQATGLAVPSYVVFGNHDGLVQGNEDANRGFEDIATGCVKPLSASGNPADPEAFFESLTPAELLALPPGNRMLVPPDPKRQFVSKEQFKDVFKLGTQTDGHGFGLVDPSEEAQSAGAAGYYSWSPIPGMRFITLDTLSEGGLAGPSADGNVDDPQYRWLENELVKATARDELVVLFSHHAVNSMLAFAVPDEAAPPCTGNEGHGHDVNPGCDVDPRSSEPIHGQGDMEALLLRHPHVIAWVAGHSHSNDVFPVANPAGGGFWMIKSAAEADWPMQSRLIEVFDNKDGTLSIFGTVLDHASDATAPAPGLSYTDPLDLASIGRTLAANDLDGGAGTGEGEANDRNVELLIGDPRVLPPQAAARTGRCARLKRGSAVADRIKGTRKGDKLRGGAGNDKLLGGKGRDCLLGERGADLLRGGPGKDRLRGGHGFDLLIARGGTRDIVRCGPGAGDRAVVDRKDRVRGCEGVARP